MNKMSISKRVAFEYGYAVRVNDENTGQYPVYGSNGITGYIDSYKVEGPGVIIGRKGSVGKITYAKKHFTPTDTAYYLRLLDSNKDNMCFWYYFLGTLGLDKLNTHSAVPGLSRSIAYLLEVKIPEKIDQLKIAKVLSLLDSKIALNNKINTELEAMAKLIYDYWFVQFDFPGANGKPYKSAGGKMVYNEALKREIPKGWGVKELNQCVDAILDHRGKTPRKLGGDWTEREDGIIALSAKLVKGGKLCNLEKANKVDQAMFDKWMPEKLRDGDILMTSEAPAGEFYFIHGKTDYCMSQRLFAIRAKQTLLAPTYLYYELSKGHGYSQILGSLSGSTVFGIRQDVLRTIKVVVPDFALQKKFDRFVLPQLKQIKNLDQENLELSKLRDWLLPMLMNGQVTVKGTHQYKKGKLKHGSSIL
ncbi:restriction endonuclease subunit S [Candidatus Berkiella cookevillensis]|uniref:Restriction endonuclease subunit S n=1 Tax=Candidatus Berkiella cookevillensis TaxID=437022 RepID=A0A0Q9YJQ0_9GAMM|nr:restriction endonuclease subunit S [Candidatus Berkiella cookevillensis]MCS5707782.1 restriction endonuclease subunit S [Candidatus Berkiella cookevillensis]